MAVKYGEQYEADDKLSMTGVQDVYMSVKKDIERLARKAGEDEG